MKRQAAVRWITITSIGLFCFGIFPPHTVRAANLDFAADYLNRQQADVMSGISHRLFFTLATSLPVSGNSVRVVFPKSPVGTWCRVAGADLSASGVSDPLGATEAATPLPGSLVASCTIGDGVTTFDTITLSNIGAITAGTKYGVAVSANGVAQLGTPPAANSITEILTTNNGVGDVDQLQFYASTLTSDQVAVSAMVVASPPTNTNPSVSFRGYSGPNATVRILRDGIQIASIPTDGDGKYDITLSDQLTGQHVYELIGIDRDGKTTALMTFALNLNGNSTTVISGVFLSPSISIDKQSVRLGQYVTVSGATAPESTVTVVIHSAKEVAFTVLANLSGLWSKLINSSDIGVGTHIVKARAYLGGSLISEFSSELTFSVDPIGPCDGKKTADLNCDGRVNLTDFSILLFFWQATNPSNARADTNGDNRVDVVDFSIMLYLWTN